VTCREWETGFLNVSTYRYVSSAGTVFRCRAHYPRRRHTSTGGKTEMTVNGSLTQSCSRPYSDAYHPCTFPFTSRASSFNLGGSSTACEVTYAESSGAFHLSSCIVHCVASTIISLCFLRLSHRAIIKRREREEASQPRSPTQAKSSRKIVMATRSLSRGTSSDTGGARGPRVSTRTSFCFGLATIEEAYLCAGVAYFLIAVGSIDIDGYGNRLPFAVANMLIELEYSLFTSIAALVVASWAKAILRQNPKAMRRVDRALYVSLVTFWCISMMGNLSQHIGVPQPGTNWTLSKRVKYFMLIFMNLLYAASAAALGLRLRSMMAKAKASSGVSRTQSKGAQAQAQAQRTIAAFSLSISIGLAVVAGYRSYKIYIEWGSSLIWATPPCNWLDSVFFMPTTAPLVLGTTFLVLLENCACFSASMSITTGAGMGSSMLSVLGREGRSVSVGAAKKAWDVHYEAHTGDGFELGGLGDGRRISGGNSGGLGRSDFGPGSLASPEEGQVPAAAAPGALKSPPVQPPGASLNTGMPLKPAPSDSGAGGAPPAPMAPPDGGVSNPIHSF